MRLLYIDDAGDYRITPNITSNNGDIVALYAILSHTWGQDEVAFADLAKRQDEWQQKAGFEKIRFCAEQARRHGLRYFWMAINSMFRWYRDAKRCYVYLSDVSSTAASDVANVGCNAISWDTAFRTSRWFTRGWTLQELVAPVAVEFYSREWVWLGDKASLELQLCDITGIPTSALCGTPLSHYSIAERESWAHNRQTKYEEDMAYSLLGIFDVSMTLNYGEGRQKAQRRLREEVQRAPHNEFTITFALSDVPEAQCFVARERELTGMRNMLSSDGSRRVVVLHGLGGIDKTQLAIAYAKRYSDQNSAICWLNIKDRTSIQQSFTKVARQILRQYPDASGISTLDLQRDHEKVTEAVKAWFSQAGNTRWLLVVPGLGNYYNKIVTV
ncbi:heterokaryon incompatibility protein-domain-containing protein [Astrocystis sublimbata]|nr:heterokaryon incompatibility protein-domain-containing protein [Astrocystis sublimbata]